VQIRNARVFFRFSCLGTITLMPLPILPAMIGFALANQKAALRAQLSYD
jgi:hypothetical protein